VIREPFKKYQPMAPVALPDRTWADKTLVRAPTWVSVDLRDGNQALVEPMNVAEKLEMFDLLVRLGFKEIEVGFPSAAQVEFDFVRTLIDRNLIPRDVWIQVLTQARPALIERTFEALAGCERAILHLYNSTSTVQRRTVFKMSQDQIVDLAVEGTRLVKKLTLSQSTTKIRYEYSPESFTGTELEFAKRICEAVMSVWEPTIYDRMVLNLPATVEMSTPNVYADQIEWMCRNLAEREKAIISVHTHNDRGSATAAAELAQLAGAERVEGTLFGYGERTGNVDLVTLALNLYSHGIDPELDLSVLDEVSRTVVKCTEETIHHRHPYAGELVFTAFSGSHQDAIGKGMQEWSEDPSKVWDVPYIPIDPKDIGRDYSTIVRVNSQSGKGGAAFVLRQHTGFELPRSMQPEFGKLVQSLAEQTGKELFPEDIAAAFVKEYLTENGHYVLVSHEELPDGDLVACEAVVSVAGVEHHLSGTGNGPIAAFTDAIQKLVEVQVVAYYEHSLGAGAESKAAAFVLCKLDDVSSWGIGTDESSSTASMKGIVSALNRIQKTTGYV
jgi:2-isopropylmalate synthase